MVPKRSGKTPGGSSMPAAQADPDPKARKWLHFAHSFPGGRSAFDKEFGKLPSDIQAGYDVLKERAADGTARKGAIKHIGDGIYELKNDQGNNPFRLLYMVWGEYFVALTVFHKKDEKTSKRVAATRKKRWLDQAKNWSKPVR